MVKRILVALSGTPFTPVAVQSAVELAQRHGASVTGVTVVDIERLSDVGPVPIGGASAAQSLAEHRVAVTQERVAEEIAGFEKACREVSIDHVVDRERGNPFELLTELWRYHDLTIIGLRGFFEYGVVQNPGDEVTKLIRHGVRPIVAVPPEYRPVNRVLLAYNGSLEAAQAMKRFAQLQLWPDVTVKLASFGFDDEKAMPLLIEAAVYLRAHGLDPEVESLPGNPKHQLRAHAQEWGADLIVMGASSRGRLAKLLLGDTAEEMLVHADVPLFLSQ